MITVKTQDLLNSKDAIATLANMDIPLRTALKLRKLLKKASADIDAAQEMLQKLGERYAERDADGKIVHPTVKRGDTEEPDLTRIKLSESMLAEYKRDVDELMATLVELPFDPIDAENDLHDPKDPPLKMKTSLLFTLDWLFKV